MRCAEALRDPIEERRVVRRQRHSARLERPLAEVVHLPGQQLFVERPSGHDAPLGQRLERPLRQREVVHGPDVEGLALVGVSLEERGERVVPEILEQHPAAFGVLAVQRRDVDPPAGKQVADLEERPAGGGRPLRSLLRLRAIGHEHGDGRATAPVAEPDAKVATRRRAAGHGLDRRRRTRERAGHERREILRDPAGGLARAAKRWRVQALSFERVEGPGAPNGASGQRLSLTRPKSRE